MVAGTQNRMLYEYTESFRAQRWNQAAVIVGTPFFGPKMVINGLQCVIRIELVPIYLPLVNDNFLLLKTQCLGVNVVIVPSL